VHIRAIGGKHHRSKHNLVAHLDGSVQLDESLLRTNLIFIKDFNKTCSRHGEPVVGKKQGGRVSCYTNEKKVMHKQQFWYDGKRTLPLQQQTRYHIHPIPAW
jgi:hypothetical protein